MGSYALLSAPSLPVLEDCGHIPYIFLRLGVCVFICVIVIWLASSNILQVDTGSYSIFSCVFIDAGPALQAVGLGL